MYIKRIKVGKYGFLTNKMYSYAVNMYMLFQLFVVYPSGILVENHN